jgi:hypothetical protein
VDLNDQGVFMKIAFLILSMLGLSTLAHARITGCSFSTNREFEDLPKKNSVKLLISSQILIESKSDYRSGENFELWMKSKTEKQRIIAANEAVKVTSLSLMGEDYSPDTLVMMFANSSELDTLAFYSRDDKSVIEKLRDSKLLHLTCTSK